MASRWPGRTQAKGDAALVAKTFKVTSIAGKGCAYCLPWSTGSTQAMPSVYEHGKT